LVSLLRETMNAQRSQNQGAEIDRAFQIYDRLKPAEPRQVDPLDQMTKMFALFRQLQPAAPPPPAVDPMDHIKKMSEFFASMGWTAPGGGGGASGGAGGVDWAGLVGSLPDLFRNGAVLVSQFIALQQMNKAEAAAAAGPGVVDVTAAPAPAPLPVSTSDEEAMNMKQQLQLLNVGRNALASIKAGESGEEFAQKLCIGNQDLYEELLDIGKAGILEALKSYPGAVEALAPLQDKADAWLDSFLAYGSPGPPAAAA